MLVAVDCHAHYGEVLSLRAEGLGQPWDTEGCYLLKIVIHKDKEPDQLIA